MSAQLNDPSVNAAIANIPAILLTGLVNGLKTVLQKVKHSLSDSENPDAEIQQILTLIEHISTKLETL